MRGHRTKNEKFGNKYTKYRSASKSPIPLIQMNLPRKSCCGSGSLPSMFRVTSIGHTWRDGASPWRPGSWVLALRSRSSTSSIRRAPHPPYRFQRSKCCDAGSSNADSHSFAIFIADGSDTGDARIACEHVPDHIANDDLHAQPLKYPLTYI
jgi:hypothetical protein